MKELLCVAKFTSLCVEIDSSKVNRDVYSSLQFNENCIGGARSMKLHATLVGGATTIVCGGMVN